MNRAVVVTAAASILGGAVVALLFYEQVLWFNMPSRSRFPVRGIDVSHHQGPIDWPAVAGGGIQFAWIKATEGGDVRDARFAENWAGATAAGVIPGAYHFFTFCRAPEEQAANFLTAYRLAVGSRGGPALPPVVDVELGGNCSQRPSDLQGDLARFSDALNAGLGRRPIVYTTVEVRALWAIEGPFWLRSIYSEPGPPWAVWQYGYARRLPGVVGLVDLNVYSGSLEELRALAAER